MPPVTKKRCRGAARDEELHAPPGEGEEHRYGERGYWDERYKALVDHPHRRAATATQDLRFEWFMDYATLRPLLRGSVALDANVIDVGCGTSTLLAEMRCDGYRGRLVGVDFSKAALRVLEALHREDEAIDLVEADVTDLSRFGASCEAPPDSFDCVVDKGTVDAMISAPAPLGHLNVKAACEEFGRVLRVGGRIFVCSHHHFDEDGDEWLETVLAGLVAGAGPAASWTLDLHLRAGAPAVYLFTKRRASTRLLAAQAHQTEVEITVHEHAQEDDDEGAGEPCES